MWKCFIQNMHLYEKNDFAEGSKILLDTDHQNNFAGTLKIMSNVAKNVDNLAKFQCST